MTPSLTKWLLFAILIPLGPLLASFIAEDSRAGGYALVSVVSRGQLLLVGVALAARSIGEILPGSKEYGASVMAIVGLAAFQLIIGTFYYAWVWSNADLSPIRVAAYSTGLYGYSITVSFACLIVSRKIANA